MSKSSSVTRPSASTSSRSSSARLAQATSTSPPVPSRSARSSTLSTRSARSLSPPASVVTRPMRRSIRWLVQISGSWATDEACLSRPAASHSSPGVPGRCRTGPGWWPATRRRDPHRAPASAARPPPVRRPGPRPRRARGRRPESREAPAGRIAPIGTDPHGQDGVDLEAVQPPIGTPPGQVPGFRRERLDWCAVDGRLLDPAEPGEIERDGQDADRLLGLVEDVGENDALAQGGAVRRAVAAQPDQRSELFGELLLDVLDQVADDRVVVVEAEPFGRPGHQVIGGEDDRGGGHGEQRSLDLRRTGQGKAIEAGRVGVVVEPAAVGALGEGVGDGPEEHHGQLADRQVDGATAGGDALGCLPHRWRLARDELVDDRRSSQHLRQARFAEALLYQPPSFRVVGCLPGRGVDH